MPGMIAQGHLIYSVPVGNIFRGFLFESSAFSAESFCPHVFVQPLYVRDDYLTMTLGDRFPGNWMFLDGGNEALAGALLKNIETRGMPFLGKMGATEALAHNPKAKDSRNHYVRQAAAYSMVMIGENQEALRRLDDLLKMLMERSGFQKWALAVHAEVASLRESLLRDPVEAKSLLERWTEETRQKLKIPS